jgi:hypothetical protein
VAKFVKREFEVEEGWLPYRTLISHIVVAKREFVYFGEMAK